MTEHTCTCSATLTVASRTNLLVVVGRSVAHLGLRRDGLAFVDSFDSGLVMRVLGLALLRARDSVLPVGRCGIGVLLVGERPLLLLVRRGASCVGDSDDQ